MSQKLELMKFLYGILVFLIHKGNESVSLLLFGECYFSRRSITQINRIYDVGVKSTKNLTEGNITSISGEGIL